MKLGELAVHGDHSDSSAVKLGEVHVAVRKISDSGEILKYNSSKGDHFALVVKLAGGTRCKEITY